MSPTTYHAGRFPPDERLDWRRLVTPVGAASRALARYDGILEAIPNPDVLVAPLGAREAVVSSQIEGTQATVGEVLEFEADEAAVAPARRDEVREVVNYRLAMALAEDLLERLPLSVRVMRELHRALLSGVRGRNKAPGELRRVQNWIGPHRCEMEEARFVPISPEQVPEAMSRWEKYLHSPSPEPLVQLAVLHAEFEAIHPFLDGNGRLGRMLIPLFLWQRGLIRRPCFYASAWFEARRDEYYERLLAVSRDDDWNGWVEFFLEALRGQAEENLGRVRDILGLYESIKERLPEISGSPHAVRLLDFAFSRPLFTIPRCARETGVPLPTARRVLGAMVGAGILEELRPGKGRRPGILAFPRLLQIVEGRRDPGQ